MTRDSEPARMIFNLKVTVRVGENITAGVPGDDHHDDRDPGPA